MRWHKPQPWRWRAGGDDGRVCEITRTKRGPRRFHLHVYGDRRPRRFAITPGPAPRHRGSFTTLADAKRAAERIEAGA